MGVTVAQLEREVRLARMALEHTALEVLEARDRIADLEADCRALREVLSAAVELLHRYHGQLARYRSALELRRKAA